MVPQEIWEARLFCVLVLAKKGTVLSLKRHYPHLTTVSDPRTLK